MVFIKYFIFRLLNLIAGYATKKDRPQRIYVTKRVFKNSDGHAVSNTGDSEDNNINKSVNAFFATACIAQDF